MTPALVSATILRQRLLAPAITEQASGRRANRPTASVSSEPLRSDERELPPRDAVYAHRRPTLDAAKRGVRRSGPDTRAVRTGETRKSECGSMNEECRSASIHRSSFRLHRFPRRSEGGVAVTRDVPVVTHRRGAAPRTAQLRGVRVLPRTCLRRLWLFLAEAVA